MRTVFLLFSLLLLSLGCGGGKVDTGDSEGLGSAENPGGPGGTGGPNGTGGPDGTGGTNGNGGANGTGGTGGNEGTGGTEEDPFEDTPESFDPTKDIAWEEHSQTTRNACHPDNLTPVNEHRTADAQTALSQAQITLGLPQSFGQVEEMVRTLAGVTTRGLLGLDEGNNVAFVVWQHAGASIHNMAGLEALMAAQTTRLSAQNLVSSAFTAWDAPPSTSATEGNALRVTFQISGSMNPAARANNIATSLLGTGSGSLTNTGTARSTQHVRAQYVLRGNGEVAVVMAVTVGDAAGVLAQGSLQNFGLHDVAGGAALARYYDRNRVRCEPSRRTANRAVDFLFVVDDSASMSNPQAALAAAGTAMANLLHNSTLNWQVALVTSTYHNEGATAADRRRNRGIIRGFTNDAQLFRAWLTSGIACNAMTACRRDWMTTGVTCGLNSSNTTTGANNGCWVGTSGASEEGLLGAARLALMDLHAGNRLRPDADLVVVILTDTEDQTSGLYSSNATSGNWEPISHFIDFFQGRDTQARRITTGTRFELVNVPAIRSSTIPVHAIRCTRTNAAGRPIACVNESIVGSARLDAVARATGGILGSINETAGIAATMEQIVDDVIGRAGIRTQWPFIGASVRVAIESTRGPCPNRAHVPRSRQDGFDYDGYAQTISFFGSCRPSAQGSDIAISYRTWESFDRWPCQSDDSGLFDKDEEDFCKGNFVCDFNSDRCICPADCGGCLVQGVSECNPNTCTCEDIVILN